MRRKAEILAAIEELDAVIERAKTKETARWDDDIRMVAAVTMEAALSWALGMDINGFENDGDDTSESQPLTMPQFVEAMTHRYNKHAPSQIMMVRLMTFGSAGDA